MQTGDLACLPGFAVEFTVRENGDTCSTDRNDMLTLVLAVPRRLAEGANVLTGEKKWAGWSPTWMLGRRIWGKRLGIVWNHRDPAKILRQWNLAVRDHVNL